MYEKFGRAERSNFPKITRAIREWSFLGYIENKLINITNFWGTFRFAFDRGWWFIQQPRNRILPAWNLQILPPGPTEDYVVYNVT